MRGVVAGSFRPLLTIAAIVLAAALLIATGFALLVIAPTDPTGPDGATATQFIPAFVGSLHPKPRDRFMFIGLAIALLAVVAGVAVLTRWLKIKADDPASMFVVAVAAVVSCALFNGFVLFSNGTSGGAFGLRAISAFFIALILAAIPVRYDKFIKPIYVVILLSGVIFVTLRFRVLSIANIEYLAHFTSHYEAVIYSIVHILRGGVCLADVLPQYGCYGEFMAPVLTMTGYSTIALTTIFAVLQISAMAAVIAFAASIISSAPLFFAAIICVIISTNLNIIINLFDPYFAYNPIRFLFPALSLPLAHWFQASVSRRRAFALGLFAGAGLAWNLDSGVAVLGAIGLFIMVGRFTEEVSLTRRFWIDAMLRLACFMAGAAIFAAAFLLYLEVRSGWQVDISNYITYQKLFYIAGFAMIPLPPFPDWWTIPAVIVGLVLLLSCLRAGTAPGKQGDRGLERAGYLAVLMLGLGLYYTGRSHWLVLRFVIWPAIILFFFLADRAWAQRAQRPWRWAGSMVAGILLGLPLYLIVDHRPAIKSVSKTLRTPQVGSVEVANDLRFIKERTSPDEAVAIMAYNQGTFYGESGTRVSVPGPSLAEMLRLADRNVEQDSLTLHGPDKVFYSQSAMSIFAFDMDAIKKAYALTEWSPSGSLMFLRHRPYAGADLFDMDGPATTWTGPTPTFTYALNKEGLARWGQPSSNKTSFQLPKCSISQSFAARMVLIPEQKQLPLAALISSHTGDFRGFAIMHQPDTEGSYFAIIGSGKEFWFSPPFVVPPETMSEIIISYRDGHLEIKVSGASVVDQKGLGSISPAVVPITIGNWQGGDRQFAGIIREVEFFASALPGT